MDDFFLGLEDAEPSRRLDAEVAEKVCGWRRWSESFGDFPDTTRYWKLRPPDWQPSDIFTEIGIERARPAIAVGGEQPFTDALSDVPRYSTDMGAARHVIEAMLVKGYELFSLHLLPGHTWSCNFACQRGPCEEHGWERPVIHGGTVDGCLTPEEAICLAALKTLGYTWQK